MVGTTSTNALHRPHRVAANPPAEPVRESAGASADPQLVAELRSEINALVHEVAQLATQDLSPEAFFTAFLNRIVTAMGAAAGAVWQESERGQFTPISQVHWENSGVDASPAARLQHGLLLKSVAAGKQAVVAPPGVGSAGA